MTTHRIILFSDLDGTLLDRETYSFAEALDVLGWIGEMKIPLVFSSGKTRWEIESYRHRLGNVHPFVAENGGGLFIPKGYFPFPLSYSRRTGDYYIIEDEFSYSQIVTALRSIEEETGVALRGFFDMTAEEISTLCRLDPNEARLAKKREYDEPFVVTCDERAVDLVRRKIEAKGFRYLRGDRFHHIAVKQDKGKAVKILTELYRRENPLAVTVGIGDSLNDIPMLLEVDQPILLKKEGSPVPEELRKRKNLILVEGTGPRAWSKGISVLWQRQRKKEKR